jgi:hypothetical protein
MPQRCRLAGIAATTMSLTCPRWRGQAAGANRPARPAAAAQLIFRESDVRRPEIREDQARACLSRMVSVPGRAQQMRTLAGPAVLAASARSSCCRITAGDADVAEASLAASSGRQTAGRSRSSPGTATVGLIVSARRRQSSPEQGNSAYPGVNLCLEVCYPSATIPARFY